MRTREGVYMLPKYEVNAGLIETGITIPLHFVSRLEKGVTHEGVLVALLDDLVQKNKKVPSEDNDLAIRHLQIALRFLEARCADRTQRGVNGTDNP